MPLEDALERVLAEPVTASRDQPPFAVSAMDGYAIRHADAPGMLRVIGESAAGRGFSGRCEPGTAVRISTGAAIPEGADTVVIQEDVRREGDRVKVPAAIRQRQYSRSGTGFYCRHSCCWMQGASSMAFRFRWLRRRGLRK